MLSRYSGFNKLGSGGMAVVYRAEDSSLGRPVALKFMTAAAAQAPEYKARFLREARVAAALNHPSICTIYEVSRVEPGEEDALGTGDRLEAGTPFIAMELIEGRTLELLLRETPTPPFERIIDIALQLTEALAAAHASSIVHRDLKPGNVMLTGDDHVKILDFGLAKPFGPVFGGDEVMTAAETVSAELTREGRVLGTVAYMSPEQAAGKKVDSRSDIFSFGVLLYEMVAGRRPFRGDSPTSTLAKILETEPEPIDESRSDLPVDLARIIRRCLAKKPDDRYNDTRDLVAALKDLKQETASGKQQMVSTGARPSAGRRKAARWALAAAGVALVVLIAAVSMSIIKRQKPPPPPPEHRQITFTGTASTPEISPDGQYVAYVQWSEDEGPAVLVHDLAGGEPLEIYRGWRIETLRWSPDGTKLLVLDELPDRADSKLLLVPRLGGSPRKLRPFSHITWAPDGNRYAGAAPSSKEITIVDLSTSESTLVPLEESFTWMNDVDWSPTDRFLAFLTSDEENRFSIWTIPLSGGKQVKVLERDARLSSLRWSGDGTALYYLERGRDTRDLWKVRVDPRTGKAAGEPAVVVAGLDTGGAISFSQNGRRLVYAKATGHSNLWLVTLDEDGGSGTIDREQLTSGTSRIYMPSISPDGQQIAFVRAGDIYTVSIDGGPPRQLTFARSTEYSPAWSPDGEWIAFWSDEGGTPKVWMISADGETPRPFEKTKASQTAWVIWHPGRRILYQKPGNRNFHLLDTETEEETALIRDDSVGWAFYPLYSPDGSQVAISWNRKDARGIWLISVEDSSELRIHDEYLSLVGWSPDWDWVYAIDGGGLVRIPAKGGEMEMMAFEWPFEGGAEYIVPAPDEGRWLCTVSESSQDIWIVDNFDPEVR